MNDRVLEHLMLRLLVLEKQTRTTLVNTKRFMSRSTIGQDPRPRQRDRAATLPPSTAPKRATQAPSQPAEEVDPLNRTVQEQPSVTERRERNDTAPSDTQDDAVVETVVTESPLR